MEKSTNSVHILFFSCPQNLLNKTKNEAYGRFRSWLNQCPSLAIAHASNEGFPDLSLRIHDSVLNPIPKSMMNFITVGSKVVPVPSQAIG
jgi:hypothetical protein